jgi:hypothetical protein
VFMWESCYVRKWRDGFYYSSAHCQVCVASCGYILSYEALNVASSQGPGSSDAYRVLENPQVWLLRARVCAEPGLQDKTGWADRWRDPAHPWLLR